MGFQAVPKTMKVDLVYGFGSGPDVLSSFYVRDLTGARGTAEASTLADAVQAWWEANVKNLQTSALSLRSIKITDLDAQFGVRFEKTVGIAGTGAGTASPVVVTALVHYQGNPGSAPRKGTVFHPGITEAQVTDQAIDATFAGNLATAYNALRTAAGFTGSQALVVVSRSGPPTFLKTYPNGTVKKVSTLRSPALTNTISSTTVGGRIGVQKRRRPSPL